MDRAGFEANTDIMVLVEPEQARLLWIPRDLWSETLQDRINTAYKLGGHQLLLKSLSEHGLEAAESLCFSRTATERAFEHVAVTGPVPVRMVFSYPLTPTSRIEDGSKLIEFNPPAETLRGERIHQWIGARGGSDLHRIERQKILLKRLIDIKFDFQMLLSEPAWYRCSNSAVFPELRKIRSDWKFETLANLFPRGIDNKLILFRGESK